MKFNFEEKSPSGKIKCIKCGHEYYKGRAIRDDDGLTKAWVNNSSCPECGTYNDDGTRKVLRRDRGEKNE